MSDASRNARLNQIAAKLLSAVQGGFQPFGAEEHGFCLNPPLSEPKVSALEFLYGIELPAGYRDFVTCVADGGAGPAYGMFSLEQALTKESGPVPGDFFRTPFPHERAYNSYDDPNVKDLWQRVESGEIPEQEAEQWDLYQRAGALVLCHEGCGYLHFLVVTGSARGQMWLDGTCSDQGFFPLGIDFLDWYERWLDNTLAGGNGVWW